MSPVDVIEADLSLTEHQNAVVDLVDAYARDPMGGGEPLAPDARKQLIPGLRQHPTTLVFLAYAGAQPVGVAVCFLGFSTFKAAPLVNIHDLGVLPTHRHQGIGTQLLLAVEKKARQLGCCKLTLEVLEHNRPALRAYEKQGFAQAVYQEAAGGALFMAKSL